MGAGHSRSLYRPGDTWLHRLRPECQLAATFLFVLAVVATPAEAYWAFGVHLAIVLAVAALGRVPLGFLLRRLVLEIPFVLFALALPFVAAGERISVLGFDVSRSGLIAALAILMKATLGLLASVVLAATTPVRDLLRGLERLRLPRQLLVIATFMIRYLDVVAGDLHRMQVARASRGYAPRNLLQGRALAMSLGALFIRSYERGERVHLAMLSRGYAGRMPTDADSRAPRAQWWRALSVPLTAAGVSATAWALG